MLSDLKFAFRQLLKNPGFTAVACLCGALACARRASRRRQAVLTLALGIGANTAAFSLLNALLLHARPHSQPDDLVRLYRTTPRGERGSHSPANFLVRRPSSREWRVMENFLPPITMNLQPPKRQKP